MELKGVVHNSPQIVNESNRIHNMELKERPGYEMLEAHPPSIRIHNMELKVSPMVEVSLQSHGRIHNMELKV